MAIKNQALIDVSVEDIMTKQVQTVSASESVKRALELMLEHDLSTIPVVDVANKCIGILSRSDLTEFFMEEDDELNRVLDAPRLSMEWLHRSMDTTDQRKVSELMTYEVSTISRKDSLASACKNLANHQIHHLPVINEDETVCGILSTFDVVKLIAKHV